VSKEFNCNILFILERHRKGEVGLCAAMKYSFHFREHRRVAVSVNEWNIFNMQDNFVLFTNHATSCNGSWSSGFTCQIYCEGWSCLSAHSLTNRGGTDEITTSNDATSDLEVTVIIFANACLWSLNSKFRCCQHIQHALFQFLRLHAIQDLSPAPASMSTNPEDRYFVSYCQHSGFLHIVSHPELAS